MSRDAFQAARAADLERIIATADAESTLAIQLRERLQDVGATHGPSVNAPRTALFLQGAAVDGTAGIDPQLAGQALLQYGRMFEEQAKIDEREAARQGGKNRRPPGAAHPKLLFTGTPRGSFGLEFRPQTLDENLLQLHGQALEKLTRIIANLSGSDDARQDDFPPPSVLRPLKLFFRSLARHDVTLRLATTFGRQHVLSREQIRDTAERLERYIVEQDQDVFGVFRGVTLESGHFDLLTDDGTITGTISADLTEQDHDRLVRLTNQRCRARIATTTVFHIDGREASSYTLLDAVPADDEADGNPGE